MYRAAADRDLLDPDVLHWNIPDQDLPTRIIPNHHILKSIPNLDGSPRNTRDRTLAPADTSHRALADRNTRAGTLTSRNDRNTEARLMPARDACARPDLGGRHVVGPFTRRSRTHVPGSSLGEPPLT
ncbi:hypothetical protein GCM10009560_18330 [Nonomuraea longicatena]|uniref:Uncharacterized protein n=1 Tax=Nonomuraea longicatena TaxID=83682 RepID=A0ABN1P1D0_9ACTN